MIAIGTVIYSSAMCFFDEFIECLNFQTCMSFDVLIINDNVNLEVLHRKVEKIKAHNVYIIDKSITKKTPAKLRVDLLLEAKRREYELLIMADCDDTFDKDRIANVKMCYERNKSYAFFYNDLILSNNNYAIKGMPNETTTIDNILQYNYLGLSNTAINLKKFSVDWIKTLNEFDAFVFDWYLYSRILLKNEKGCFVKNAPTIYRIYENNYVGINEKNIEMLEKEIDVKRYHYRNLSKYNERFRRLHEIFDSLSLSNICINKEKTSFWWSNILINNKFL